MLRQYLRLAVIGDPVAHSKSPSLHSAFLREAELAGSYEAIRVSASDALDSLERLFSAGYLGLNVTTPLKEIVLGVACDADPIVRTVAAANTLIATPDGWHAANTDGIGAFCSMYGALEKTELDPRFAPDVALQRSVLIAGTGPTARAAAFACGEHGMEVYLTGRDAGRVNMLAAALQATPWDGRLITDAIFSTLPPDAEVAPALLTAGKAAHVVIDANYGDRATLAQNLGRPVVDGAVMLAAQARASFERWRALFAGSGPPSRIQDLP